MAYSPDPCIDGGRLIAGIDGELGQAAAGSVTPPASRPFCRKLSFHPSALITSRRFV
jgi:hypothetical protein